MSWKQDMHHTMRKVMERGGCLSQYSLLLFSAPPLIVQITTEGASIGQSELNTVSIPSDNMLAPLNHAIVMYEGGGSGRGSENMGVSVGSDDASTGGTGTGGDNTPGKVNDGAVGGGVGPRTGGFFFSDGGQGTDFAAALRIRVGEGNRDWPLTQVRSAR